MISTLWKTAGRGAKRRACRPGVEGLEGRALLSGTGSDYALSGFSWANPSHVTYSLAPDGVAWDHGTNDLRAALDARLGAGTWERDVARALATWESVANINVSQVSETGAWGFDARGRAQGDPRFGDIRFGGYAFAGDTTTLAQTYFPPPQGSTAAGDMDVNTAMNYNTGSDYDFFSVVLHETGHALGLEHAADPTEVMYPSYGGVRTGLGPGDIAGIQAIYGARTPDAFQSRGLGTTPADAVDLSAALGGSLLATVPGASLSAVGDTEYFRVVAPAGSGGTLRVAASAGGVSLLSPRLTVLDASGAVLASQGDPGAWGDDVAAEVHGVTPGQVYTIAVTGATSDAFAVGAYQLAVAFPDGTRAAAPVTPVIPPPAPAPVVAAAPPATSAPVFNPVTTPAPVTPASPPVVSTPTPVASASHPTTPAAGSAAARRAAARAALAHPAHPVAHAPAHAAAAALARFRAAAAHQAALAARRVR